MTRKKEMRNQMNCHHKIGQSLRNYFVVEDARNKIIMNITEHNHLHGFFKDALTPKSQLNKLKELYDSVLSDTARELFRELLSLSDKEFYIDGIVRNERKSTRSNKKA